LRDSLDGLRSLLGAKELERLLGQLDPAAQRVYREPVLATEWYPVDAFTTLLDAFVREHEGGDPAALVSHALRLFEKQFSGAYWSLVGHGSPEALVRRVAATHALYFRGTRVDVVRCGQGEARARYTGFAPRHAVLDHCIVGFYAKGLKMSGARDPAVAVATGTAEGLGYSEIAMTWR
jgi:hypothetical protein